MKFAKNFIHCFFSTSSITKIVENDKEFFCELSATDFLSPDISKVEAEFNFLQSTDQLSFTISFGEANPISFHSSNTDFENFKVKLDAEYLHQEGEPINATFTITKSNVSNHISIYDLEVFSSTIEHLNTEQSLAIFNRVLSENHFVVFNVYNLDKPFGTSSIFFVPMSANAPIGSFADRQKRLDNVISVSNYGNFQDLRLTPDDFKIQVENIHHKKLCLLFNRFAAILSVVYLFDITALNANQLDFKINGYKSIKGIIDVTQIKEIETTEYYEIYNWVYTGGNLNDKIGLARNIITLHFSKSGGLELKGNVFQSIQSSF